MSESKEFLGKTLDAAIAEACSYYDVPREKLEIEIIEDAKTGIFGIVGARKAKIRARLAKLPDFMQGSLQQEKPERQEGRRKGRGERRREKNDAAESVKEEPRERRETAKEKHQEAERDSSEAPAQEERVLPAIRTAAVPALAPAHEDPAQEAGASDEGREGAEESADEAPRSRRSRQSRGAARKEAAQKNEEADALESTLPRVPLAELDQERLAGTTKNIISRLVAPILDVDAGSVDLSLEIGEDRVQVSVKSEDTGLLIGRDGQNLAAVQYLASRMITRAMGSQVRLQVDAGDYHVRQDSRLQELALALAEKVKATGKVQTTRPLSAYQRRVIHLALQDDPEVQTRSSGEGALKHVVILRRKD